MAHCIKHVFSSVRKADSTLGELKAAAQRDALDLLTHPANHFVLPVMPPLQSTVATTPAVTVVGLVVLSDLHVDRLLE